LSLHTIQNDLLQEQDIYLKNKSSLQTNDVVFILLDNQKHNFGTSCIDESNDAL
ncbi:hypothetical protein AAJ76_3710001444, partial [Vairimorpha ceranae]